MRARTTATTKGWAGLIVNPSIPASKAVELRFRNEFGMHCQEVVRGVSDRFVNSFGFEKKVLTS